MHIGRFLALPLVFLRHRIALSGGFLREHPCSARRPSSIEWGVRLFATALLGCAEVLLFFRYLGGVAGERCNGNCLPTETLGKRRLLIVDQFWFWFCVCLSGFYYGRAAIPGSRSSECGRCAESHLAVLAASSAFPPTRFELCVVQ